MHIITVDVHMGPGPCIQLALPALTRTATTHEFNATRWRFRNTHPETLTSFVLKTGLVITNFVASLNDEGDTDVLMIADMLAHGVWY